MAPDGTSWKTELRKEYKVTFHKIEQWLLARDTEVYKQ